LCSRFSQWDYSYFNFLKAGINMRILITSGTGMIGRALTAELIAGGHSLWTLSRNPQASTLAPGETMVQWDSQSTRGWGHLVNEVDAIINLTGENIGAGRWTPARKREIVFSRVEAGQAVMEACRTASSRPKVLLQASAIGYYGKTGERTLTESDPPGDDFLGQACAAWEGATKAVEDLGMRHIVTRTGLVVARKGGFMDPVLLQYRLFGGGPLGSGRQWWSWILLSDVVRAMRFLIENERASGPYNLTAPNPVRMKDFGRAVGSVLRRPHLIPIPAFALKLVLGEMSQLVLEGQRVIPDRLQSAGFEFQYDEIQPALEKTLR
jgi:uncharacterized protein